MRFLAFLHQPGRLLATVFLFAAIGAYSGCDNASNGTTAPSTNPKDSSMKQQPATPEVGENDKKACREAVESLLELAAKGKNADAAPLMAYRGQDKERKWKTICDYANPEDQVIVDKTIAKLQVITSDMEGYDFKEFLTEQENEGTWYVWVVEIKYGNATSDRKAFAFLKLDGKFALGDID